MIFVFVTDAPADISVRHRPQGGAATFNGGLRGGGDVGLLGSSIGRPPAAAGGPFGDGNDKDEQVASHSQYLHFQC